MKLWAIHGKLDISGEQDMAGTGTDLPLEWLILGQAVGEIPCVWWGPSCLFHSYTHSGYC